MSTFKKVDKLPDGFVSAVDSMTADEMKERIVKLERAIAELDKAMEADEKLSEAKELVKELKSDYTVPIKEAQLCIRYICWVMDQRGNP